MGFHQQGRDSVVTEGTRESRRAAALCSPPEGRGKTNQFALKQSLETERKKGLYIFPEERAGVLQKTNSVSTRKFIYFGWKCSLHVKFQWAKLEFSPWGRQGVGMA